MLRVKICGITRIQDAIQASELGADAIGFIFYKKSLRYISPEAASQVAKQLPSHISRVGVFVNPDRAELTNLTQTIGLDALQIHGLSKNRGSFHYDGKPVIMAIQVNYDTISRDINYYQDRSDAILLDTAHHTLSGGTGISFDWKYAVDFSKYHRIILAGGLDPDNISRAVETVHPYAVDVSSGLEKQPGIKDPDKLIAFFKNIRKYRNDWKPAGNRLFPIA
jgi:phosphoribosylanthranilate isomerase